ncbi:MAG: dTDP-4-dehydrorhamnose reductase [bacterium]|nr:dTDP-4-dehydrorhamnose reductase [bacterium]
MKILILGSKGMLGQELSTQLSALKHEVEPFDIDDLDITDTTKMRETILYIKPDVIINAVAINAVDRIEDTPATYETAKKINALAVGEMAKICRAQNIILVHYSSDYVFPGTDKNGYDENAVPAPLNKYGETKALGEKLLQENNDRYYLIRLSKLFGKPAVSSGAKKSFVDTIIGLAVGGKDQFDFVDDEMSAVTYAPDLAEFTIKLLQEKYPFGIYHGANSGACTWYGWAKEIFALKNIKADCTPVSMDKYPRPAQRPRFSQLLNTKLPPQRSWQVALREYLL